MATAALRLDPAGDSSELERRFLVLLEGGALDLPAIPETATEVLAACRSDETGAGQIATMLQRDPALAGHVLRVANSAAYSSGEPIVSLAQAVSRLGVGSIAELITALVIRGRAFAAPRHQDLVRAIWKHSATAGAWAREIARMRRRSVEGAFLCGLLHDVGKPVILKALVELVQAGVPGEGEEPVLDIMERFHPRVGALLARSWEFPAWMAEAIARHHEPESATEHRDEVWTTVLANQLAHESLAAAAEAGETALAEPIASALSLYPEDFTELLSRREKVMALAGALA